jgi:membrane fusion protein, multidrug efflux system
MNKVIYIATIILAISSCNRPKSESSSQTETADESAIVNDTLEVETQVAEIRTFTYPVQASGKIKAEYDEQIFAQNSGLLAFCKARNGLLVKEKEVLASLETSDLELKQERILVQKFNAQKEYESQLLGYENLLKEKTALEAEAVRQKLKAATGLLSLEIDLKELEQERERAVLRAPIDGILSQVKIKKGMNLRPGQELYRIYSANDLFLEGKVLESDLPLLKIGQLAIINSVANPNASYQGKLSVIDPLVDEHGLLTIQIKVMQPRNLLLGMNASAEIKVPQKRGIIVPRNAVVLRNNRPVVFTWEKGYSKWNYVTTGSENGASIEILEGISAGSEVIISDNVQLAHNLFVKKR